jgi:pimeloyl-ACP methyl ester carboxylesterase
MRPLALATGCLLLIAGRGSLHAQPSQSPAVRQARVNGTTLRYVEQGHGLPVVFLHGAISDHRYWERQRDAIASRYRFIAIDRRFFGEARWPDSSVRVSQDTDAADLAALIRALAISPAIVVAVSGGANVALITAVRHPDVVRALFLQEPGVRSIIADSSDLATVRLSEVGRSAARDAAKAGNMTQAARLFLENANGQAGVFERLSPVEQAMFVSNARTLTLPPVPEVRLTCEELSRIRVPVTISKGQFTKPASVVLAEAAHRCIRHSQMVTIPNATHGAPRDNPDAFNAQLLAFLARNSP